MPIQIPAYSTSKLTPFLEAVEKTVKERLSAMNSPARTGGYFCLAETNGESFAIICVIRLGSPTDGMSTKCQHFAIEKTRRLRQNPGHMSSWQTRNEARQKYGGAIRAGKFIFSFSGFSEIEDECAMLLAARQLDLFSTSGQDVEIARLSHNKAYLECVGVPVEG